MPPILDVLVVGAGPTGLFLAHELARHGARCRVIEKLSQATDKSKAFAVHARTMEVFDQAGIAEDFATAGVHVTKSNVNADGRRLARLSFDTIDSRFPYLLSLPQSETERLLARRVNARGVDVARPVELASFTQDEHRVTAQLRSADGKLETVSARYLVGCDGSHSTVRHALGIEFDGVPYAETFGLADVTLKGDLAPDEMHIHLSAGGALFILGFGGGRYRLVTSLEDAGTSDEMTEDEWRKLLAERGPPRIAIQEMRWMSRFRIHRRHARSLSKGRAFLAGDAAHIHSPAGGQGMNTGLQDAHNLAWKLALVARGEAAPELLASYEAERRPIHAAVLTQTDRMTKLGLLKNPLARRLRNHLIPVLASLPATTRAIGKNLAELGIHYRGSPIVTEKKLPGGPVSGEHATDGDVVLSGVDHRLAELFRHGSHSLLLFAGTSPTEKGLRALADIGDRVSRERSSHVAAHFVVTRDMALPGWHRPPLLDAKGPLHRAYGAKAPCFYLVRPDGYVACRGPASAGDVLHGHLARLLPLRQSGAAPV